MGEKQTRFNCQSLFTLSLKVATETRLHQFLRLPIPFYKGLLAKGITNITPLKLSQLQKATVPQLLINFILWSNVTKQPDTIAELRMVLSFFKKFRNAFVLWHPDGYCAKYCPSKLITLAEIVSFENVIEHLRDDDRLTAHVILVAWYIDIYNSYKFHIDTYL